MAEADGADNAALTGPETATDQTADDAALQSTEQGAEVESQGEPEELEEIEFGGDKYGIPKALKGAFLMQADYTRKTQEVAEQRKAFDSEREAFTKEMEARRESEKEIGRLAVMNEQLEAYLKVDWATFRASNPEQAAQAFQDFTLLKHQTDQLAAKVKSDVEKRTANEQQSFAKRYAETNAILARDIPGWGNELATNLRDFAIANGATPDLIQAWAVNASAVKILHQAWLGQQLIQKQQAAAKAVKDKPAVAEVKPLTEVKRRPSAAARPGLHDDLSPQEWLKRRNAQVRRTGA